MGGRAGAGRPFDADVAAHAACDALLMATGIGELGTIFGTGRPEWDGASGETLLRESVRLVREAGWEIANVSADHWPAPRFAPRKAESEAVMSEIVEHPSSSRPPPDRMGFTGRDEGLAAIATALVTG